MKTRKIEITKAAASMLWFSVARDQINGQTVPIKGPEAHYNYVQIRKALADLLGSKPTRPIAPGREDWIFEFDDQAKHTIELEPDAYDLLERYWHALDRVPLLAQDEIEGTTEHSDLALEVDAAMEAADVDDPTEDRRRRRNRRKSAA